MAALVLPAPARVPVHAPALRMGAASAPSGGPWDLWITERETGAVVAMLGPRALNDATLTRRVSGPDSLVFSMEAYHPAAASMVPFETEVQLFYGGHLVLVGPMVHVEQDGSSPFDTYTCMDVMWYLSRRFYGEVPWARNWLRNPTFEFGVTSWTCVDAEVDTEVYETGTQSIRLGGSISQNISPDLSSNPWGATIRARVRIPSSVTADLRGLEVRVAALGVASETELVVAPITAATPRDTWTDLTCVLPTKARLTPGINVLLHIDDDDVHVNAMSFRITSADGASIDQPLPVAVDAGELIRSLSGQLNLSFRREGVGSAAIGIDVDRFADELLKVPVEAQLCDFYVDATRTTRTIVQVTPRRGRDIDADELHLEFALGPVLTSNIDTFTITRDYTKARSQMIMIGDQGYHGVATDENAWGGLLLQDQDHAPSNTLVDDLDPMALRELRATLGDVSTVVVTPKNLPYGAVEPGDRVRLDIDQWSRQVHGMHRIGEFSVVLAENRIGELGLTAEPVAP